MKRTTIILIMMTVLTTNLCAAIITVDINHPSVGDYITLQEAHDAASPGDTIYVYPSLTRYDGIHVTKKLNLIGAGFSYDCAVDGVYPSRISDMYFDAGSAGSVLKGFEAQYIKIEANNTKILNNYCRNVYSYVNLYGLVIMQNMIINTSSTYLYAVRIISKNQALISNNIIYNPVNSSICIYSEGEASLYISNNVLYSNNSYALYLNNKTSGMIINNIILNGSIYGNTIEYHNNMSNSTQLNNLLGAGNIGNVDMSKVFVDADNHNYKLKPDSPALGAGYSGEDLGIYGGQSPYVDNGAGTGLPTIISLTAQPFVPSGNATMNVKIKATSGSPE